MLCEYNYHVSHFQVEYGLFPLRLCTLDLLGAVATGRHDGWHQSFLVLVGSCIN